MSISVDAIRNQINMNAIPPKAAIATPTTNMYSRLAMRTPPVENITAADHPQHNFSFIMRPSGQGCLVLDAITPLRTPVGIDRLGKSDLCGSKLTI